MKIFVTLFLTGSMATIMVPAPAQGAPGEAKAKVTYPSFEDTNHLHGPKIKAADLKNRVVFFEYWGIDCPPCIASMSHLQELQNKYQMKGFIVVGSHRQKLSPRVKQFLEKKKITFPVYQGLNIPVASCPGGLPHAVLIGANGRVVAKGHPTALYALVENEVLKMDCSIPILERVELDKYKALAKTIVSHGSNIESKITPLRKKTDDKEAQAICAAFDAWLEDAKNTAREQIQSHPLKALTTITRLKVAVPSVKEFDEDLAALKANRDLSKLSDINKKIAVLEERHAKGRKIAESEIKPLAQTVYKLSESENNATRTAANSLRSTLSFLAAQAD